MAWVAAQVCVAWQAIWGVSMSALSAENGTGGSSPVWTLHAPKSTLRPSMRGGVPVFSRPVTKPWRCSERASATAGRSPMRPARQLSSPRWMTPRRNVPVVITTAPQAKARPSTSVSPGDRAVGVEDDVVGLALDDLEPALLAQQRADRPCVELAVGPWALGPRTAGPLLALSMRNWMPARSIARAMTPSSASISHTRWPLPRPPMAGLQDIAPIVALRCVTSRVEAPQRAAAAAASVPA